MKKIVVMMTIFICIVSNEMLVASQTINEADTDLCDTLKYALINRLREPIDKAIGHIYQDDDEAPEGLTWASYDTEILKIKQLYGVGGTYEITLEVKPYYRAHIYYGEDIVVVNTDGELIRYEHIKTYPSVQVN